MAGQPDSRSPSPEEVLRTVVRSFLEELHTMMPAQVVAYDSVRQTVDAQPVVLRSILAEDGQEITESFPVVPGVPVVFPRANRFFVSFPLQPGDFVTLVIAERSIDKWLASAGAVTHPADFRRHDLSDAVAFPGLYPVTQAIKEISATAMVVGVDLGVQLRIPAAGPAEIGTSAGVLDFVAMAQKVLTELNAVKADLVAFKTVFDAHVHILTLTAGTGTAAPPAVPVPTPHTPASVAAMNLKTE